MIVEIQCLANPPGTPTDRWAHIDAAIRVIQESGLPYEVSPLGTTFEGEPDAVWPVVRRVHEACLKAGARSLVSVIKVEQAAGEGAPTMGSLTAKFR
jgi:uncharacterized protein YqgV (UPF0045/DUF77 family)